MTNYTDEGKKAVNNHEIIVIVNFVLNVPLILISITGNLLVLVAILKTPSIRTPSMIMISSLAVSDLLVGIIAQPLFLVNEFKNLRERDLLLHSLTSLAGFFVQYHMRYSSIVTKPRVLYTVVLTWLFSFLCLGLYFWDKPLYHLLAGIYTALCLIICTYLYIKIYGIVRHHQLQIHVQEQAVDNSDAGSHHLMLRLKKSALSTFLFYICMVICYFPNVILMALFGTLYAKWRPEWDLATTVVFMNSSINPILYCWRLRELRAAVTKIGNKMLHTQTDEVIATTTHTG